MKSSLGIATVMISLSLCCGSADAQCFGTPAPFSAAGSVQSGLTLGCGSAYAPLPVYAAPVQAVALRQRFVDGRLFQPIVILREADRRALRRSRLAATAVASIDKAVDNVFGVLVLREVFGRK